MTCIICVFNPEKVIVSEDSAVSSESRTYTGVEKTIPLSNDPPMIMSFYGNSDFDDIPLENIINEIEIMPKHEIMRLNYHGL